MDGIKIKREKTKKIVPNATAALIKIHHAISEEFKNDPFYYSFYMFALQGRRKSEILNLKWNDIADGYYVLRDTKTGEDQKIFLPENIREQLELFRMDTEYVFTSRITGTKLVNIEKTTKRLKKRLGDSFSLHFLRNVIVSAMAENGLEAIYLSGALGHSDPHTVTKYLSMNYMKGSELASRLIKELVSKQ
jgi:integrase